MRLIADGTVDRELSGPRGPARLHHSPVERLLQAVGAGPSGAGPRLHADRPGC